MFLFILSVDLHDQLYLMCLSDIGFILIKLSEIVLESFASLHEFNQFFQKNKKSLCNSQSLLYHYMTNQMFGKFLFPV